VTIPTKVREYFYFSLGRENKHRSNSGGKTAYAEWIRSYTGCGSKANYPNRCMVAILILLHHQTPVWADQRKLRLM
jgi:hypothetical protein